MLFPICPSCGTILANIQLAYQRDMIELCERYNINYDSLSHGAIIANEKFSEDKRKIVDRYVDRMCCKMRLINFSDVARLINY